MNWGSQPYCSSFWAVTIWLLCRILKQCLNSLPFFPISRWLFGCPCICVFSQFASEKPSTHNYCGKWIPTKFCDLHKLLSGAQFPPLSGKTPDSSSGKRPRRVQCSVEIASLSSSALSSFLSCWCNRWLWPPPFAFLVPHQGTNWLAGLDPPRWLRSCASTLQITKFLLDILKLWIPKFLKYWKFLAEKYKNCDCKLSSDS